eukprot:PhF_6_TR38139/c0_g1_i2/m.56964
MANLGRMIELLCNNATLSPAQCDEISQIETSLASSTIALHELVQSLHNSAQKNEDSLSKSVAFVVSFSYTPLRLLGVHECRMYSYHVGEILNGFETLKPANTQGLYVLPPIEAITDSTLITALLRLDSYWCLLLSTILRTCEMATQDSCVVSSSDEFYAIQEVGKVGEKVKKFIQQYSAMYPRMHSIRYRPFSVASSSMIHSENETSSNAADVQ